MKTPSNRIPSRFTCDGGGHRLSSETGVQVRGALLLLPALDTLKLYIADDRGTGSGGCSCAATRVATRAAGSPCLVSETRAGWTLSQSMTGDVAAALERTWSLIEQCEHLRCGLLVLCDKVQPEHGELRIGRERLCAGNRARRRVEHMHAPG